MRNGLLNIFFIDKEQEMLLSGTGLMQKEALITVVWPVKEGIRG